MNIAALILLAVLGQKADPENDAAALVEKLGSARYAEREATKSLENLGSKALPALRPVLKSRDPEVRTRARSLINKIEGNLLTQASQVRLDFKDSTLDEIVKSLSKQVGFEIGLGGVGMPRDRTGIGSRRVTLLEPEPVSFWQAIDRLCEVGQLGRNYQNVNLSGQGRPRASLVLTYQPEIFTQPGYNHGPFHLTVVSLTYTSRISFNASERTMFAQTRPMMRQGNGLINPGGAGLPERPLPANGPQPGDPKSIGPGPARRVQFLVQLQVFPEPRMTINRTGSFQLLEAADELGQSLLPGVNGGERSPVQMGMVGSSGMVGMVPVLSAQLHRPETPGKLIKKLRGTVEVGVLAARSDPLVIPLEGAVGKTFQNDDRRVVVSAIEHDPMRRQDVIELQIDDLDELFPPEPVSRAGLGPRPAMMGPGVVNRFSNDPSLSPIQVVSTKGQNLFCQTSFDWESGRITLRAPQMPQDQAKEIRISAMIRASAQIPFDFHDLPMP